MATMTRIGPIEIGANATIPQNGDATFSTVGVLVNSYLGLTTAADGGGYLAWNLSMGTGEMDFVCNRGPVGGGFNWYNAPPDTLVDHTMPPDMALDSFGVLTLERGGINVPGQFSLGPPATGPSVISDNATLALNASAGSSLLLNWFAGDAVHFGDGAQSSVAMVDQRGDASFSTVAVLLNSYRGITTGLDGGGILAWNLSGSDAEMDFVSNHGTAAGGFASNT